MKLKQLLLERDKLEAERLEVEAAGNRATAEAEGVATAGETLELSEAAEKQFAKLKTKAELCPARLRKIQGQIVALDKQIAAEYVATAREEDRRATAGEAALLKQITTLLRPFFNDEADAEAQALKVVNHSDARSKIWEVFGTVSTARVLEIRTERPYYHDVQETHVLAWKLVKAIEAAGTKEG